jgi:hypothetical protein
MLQIVHYHSFIASTVVPRLAIRRSVSKRQFGGLWWEQKTASKVLAGDGHSCWRLQSPIDAIKRKRRAVRSSGVLLGQACWRMCWCRDTVTAVCYEGAQLAGLALAEATFVASA